MPDGPLGDQKIVIRYLDGRILKGYTHDFFPNKENFHITLEDDPSKKPLPVEVSHLKAVFYVKDFIGNKDYNEKKDFSGAALYGKKIAVKFKDGETLSGTTQSYLPDRKGFFMFPVDPKSNNIRIFVVNSSIKEVHFV